MTSSIRNTLSRIIHSSALGEHYVYSRAEEEKARQLNLLSAKVRLLTIDSIYRAGSGHGGTSLSIVDIITALLFHRLNWNKFLAEVEGKSEEEQWRYWQNPELPRDRFVLSKGHGVPSWYAALAVGGYIEKDELSKLRAMDSRLQGHPERKRFPFIDGSTGSLGQGQSVALGYALANKTRGRGEKVYCIIGDGECNEGQVWESAMSAPKFELDNLVYIVDFNKKQSEGANDDVMNVEWLHSRWKVFRWHTQRIDGHDMKSLVRALEECDKVKGKPHAIIADTHKGYLGGGETFMGGGHNPVVDQESFEKAVRFLGDLANSYARA